MPAKADTNALEAILLDPDPAPLRDWSATGRLADLIPQWQRLTGDRNVQHSAHHFYLDDHTCRVVEGVRRSNYYQPLSRYQQWLATLSALLHDIDKNTGPERLRGQIPVDKLHPIKSAEMSKTILAGLKEPLETIQRIYTLIHHHQAFGRLFIFYPDGAPELPLWKIAAKVRSVPLLACLLALSEGDIRGVQQGDAYFTPQVAEKLTQYADTVIQMIRSFEAGLPLFPQGLQQDADSSGVNLTHSAGFALTAPDWPALFTQLASWTWGGAKSLPYYPTFSRLAEENVACAALIRFLPENIAYWGPCPDNVPMQQALSMDAFYALLLGQPLDERTLSAQEAAVVEALRQNRLALAAWLNTFAQAQGFSDWVAYRQSFEPALFDMGSCPQLDACWQAYRHTTTQPIMGIATRPMVMGFFSRDQAIPDLPSEWHHYPVISSR